MSDRPQPLRIAITTGEPAGVGPELTARALADAATRWPDARFTVLGDAGLIAARAAAVGLDWTRMTAAGGGAHVANAHVANAHVANAHVAVAHRALAAPAEAGKLNPANGRYVLDLLDAAIDGALAGEYDAIVTAPLQKSTINDAGVPFTGHTEYLAERTRTPHVVMMLAGTGERPLRVALATTHLPLRDVSAALTIDGLADTLSIIDRDLRGSFGLAAPRILVTGLNPHAGEHGYLGREEIDVIEPALERARAAGIDARGPYPADTLFQPRYLEHADCVLAMFHDQGLPVLKYATFGEGINVTLGLPIIRTSVDHGTALDLAGTGRADPGSLVAAIDTAVTMARHRRAG
ncbi:4-hydroxythreonine-4-phosphate dehydrogenase [Burkholderia pseudomallei]|uniref:4-hydroxythreonine-4-phosphate dehydrogenase PdxA n=1 Tax=Burkholderia pseudomallei TaxID=28450 RepID=UPI000055B466|nr:4-hydroxythreonine-4-phosphate dehydrogenase PdxA [Burkholderia pseudomallei]AIP58742.1 4-hydroxythreonine-4-phosphate dehydrogenase PdxA [Burkholderia pseudomallei HBPUB10303a]AJX60066.1 4-hydroxythreonine-4-phosphate dehydrogenase PdxA [Burkholderia pseudomallei Pasteur 52237]ALB92738.1 4-hydroxythreonine-4-phosphate dehydrogenase [Burkholderia pseudomallei]ALB98801.1 4-hydroxythreonine-4-phosphate dehydrogenase [Burkholderia pseudomallei]ARK48462.1 4-hydroxythreonine-4-phosphate dehydrog